MGDAEFQLLVEVCGVSMGKPTPQVPSRSIRWDRFLGMAGRHRVEALCWEGLKPRARDVPEPVAATLKARARETAIQYLRSAAECGDLYQAFQAEDVPVLFLKGVTLGALAYPNPHVKMSIDIDLLVDAERLFDAARLLRAAGYELLVPATTDDHRLGRWHDTRKESVWQRAGFQLDLHTRPADHPALLPGLGATSPFQPVSIASGVALPTFADEELFAYLSVHGASSAWFRLKWVADFSALIGGKQPNEIAHLYQRSQQLGAGRAAAQALLLAERIHGVELGDLHDRLVAEPTNRWLTRLAEHQLRDPREPTEHYLGTSAIHLSQLALLPGWRFTLSEAARQVRDYLARDGS